MMSNQLKREFRPRTLGELSLIAINSNTIKFQRLNRLLVLPLKLLKLIIKGISLLHALELECLISDYITNNQEKNAKITWIRSYILESKWGRKDKKTMGLRLLWSQKRYNIEQLLKLKSTNEANNKYKDFNQCSKEVLENLFRSKFENPYEEIFEVSKKALETEHMFYFMKIYLRSLISIRIKPAPKDDITESNDKKDKLTTWKFQRYPYTAPYFKLQAIEYHHLDLMRIFVEPPGEVYLPHGKSFSDIDCYVSSVGFYFSKLLINKPVAVDILRTAAIGSSSLLINGELKTSIKKIFKLNELKLFSCTLDYNACNTLRDIIQKSYLKKIILNACIIDYDSLHHLLEGLIGISTLLELHIQCMTLNEKVVRTISNILNHPECTIQKLDFSQSEFEEDSLFCLSPGLKLNYSLSHINLHNITTESNDQEKFEKLISIISNHNNLSFLNLKSLPIKLSSIPFLLSTLSTSKSIQHLVIAHIYLNNVSTLNSLKLLMTNSVLKTLELDFIGAKFCDVAASFFELLEGTTLNKLYIQESRIQDKDLKYLIPLLTSPSPWNLTYLDLTNNHLTVRGVSKLAASLLKGYRPELTINVEGNQSPFDKLQQHKIKDIEDLFGLGFPSKFISDEGIESLDSPISYKRPRARTLPDGFDDYYY